MDGESPSWQRVIWILWVFLSVEGWKCDEVLGCVGEELLVDEIR